MSTGWEDDFDVLPDTTSDERADGWGESDESADDRFEQERPPHWD
ncbi:MAG: hypothetical protein ACRDVO_10190 [Jiangellaceae bacterium]|jgi:hypothetical protein|nr:hypothetical protein [Jiangellaceae bacterium]